jgi:outer membrane lipoprotein-sorting protein
MVRLSVYAQQRERGVVSVPAVGRDHRIALLIGNSDYLGQTLRNPVNDANDFGAVLRDTLDFDVEIIRNADLRTFDFAVQRFVAKLSPGDVGLFYFSGHGLEVEGENYLLPVNFAAVSQADVKYQAYAANRVMDLMKDRGVRLSILILDACRNNPYRSWKGGGGGLAGMTGEGAFIAFAAGAGKMADDNPGERNGLFTKYLLEVVREPGLNIGDVFDRVREGVYRASDGRQVPFSYSGIIGNFFFRPKAVPLIPAGPAGGTFAPSETISLRYGNLEISSDQGGTVYVDGQRHQDLEPFAALSLSNLKAGPHTIRVEKPNYSPEQREIIVLPDQVATAEFRLTLEVPEATPRGAPPNIPALRTSKVALSEVLSRVNEAAKHLKTVTAELDYTAVTAQSNDRSIESGHFYLANPKNPAILVRFEKPDRKTILFKRDQAQVFYPGLNRIEEYTLMRQTGLLEQFLLLGFGTDVGSLKAAYEVKLIGEEDLEGELAAVLELTPKQPAVASQLVKIQLWIGEGSGLPAQQQFFEPGGDYLVARYTDVKVNQDLPRSIFDIWAPGAERVRKN